MSLWVEDIKHLPTHEIAKGLHGRFFHSQQMSFVYWEIEESAILPEHSHPHEQVAQILDGHFELTVNGETKLLGAGAFAIIPANAVHSGKAISACRIVDVFYPKREDYQFRG